MRYKLLCKYPSDCALSCDQFNFDLARRTANVQFHKFLKTFYPTPTTQYSYNSVKTPSTFPVMMSKVIILFAELAMATE